ncbi:uncharacterized protein N7473_008419, partial [Penicillium subrubescens]|uniref:uncharacterized protein n=1 Tax=Penicillium subrubescens TaxID=1316194 RepID=UPI002545A1C9
NLSRRALKLVSLPLSSLLKPVIPMPPSPPFKCPFPGCTLSYQRKEHLTRHAKSHSKQLETFKCLFCDRSFSRNDTLRHHVRSHHQDKDLKSSRTIKACTYCRGRRSKCDGHDPCDRCSRLGKECSYLEKLVSRSGTLDGERELAFSRPGTRLGSSTRSEGLEYSPCRVKSYVQAYFDVFHPKWPFLHPATFDHTSEPAFLLQSVVMMGMWVSRESTVQKRAKDLHRRLILCIYEQMETWAIPENYDALSGPTHWPLATYQGILLQTIFSLLRDQDPIDLGLTTVLPEIPSQLLKALVHSCLKRNMLFYPSMLSQFRQGESPEVYVWVGVEEVKRFALSLYRVCQRARLQDPGELGGVSCQSNWAPSRLDGVSLLSLADLRFALPDSNELWHLTSGLADRLTGKSEGYRVANSEENWISQAVRLLQPQGEQFRWI